MPGETTSGAEKPKVDVTEIKTDTVVASTDPKVGEAVAAGAGANVMETLTTGLGHFFAAMDRGAALVYHKVVAMEAQVANWEASNPIIQELVSEGVTLGTTFLTGYGLSVPNVELAASAVMATLKTMAASDPTVKSGV